MEFVSTVPFFATKANSTIMHLGTMVIVSDSYSASVDVEVFYVSAAVKIFGA